jgi:hypothetical protein
MPEMPGSGAKMAQEVSRKEQNRVEAQVASLLSQKEQKMSFPVVGNVSLL